MIIRKKKCIVAKKTLTKTDIDYLKRQTSFSEFEIVEWFSKFIEVSLID